MDKNTCCQLCVKEFFKVSNLRRHIKKFHPEIFKPTPKKEFAFTCEVCGKNFSYIRNYRCHMKTHDSTKNLDSNPPQIKIKKQCPLCSFAAEKTELFEHFSKVHEITMNIEELAFEGTESFTNWKKSLESNTQSHFIRGYTQQTKSNEEVIFFVCHRSGHYSPKSKTTEKVKNDAVTKKIGGYCPASIKMRKKSDGRILAKFIHTHIGHSNEEDNALEESTKKMKNILLRHKNSCNMDMNSLVKSENVWQFHSKKGDEIYVISAQENHCRLKCPLTCKDCKVCIHRYSCSCKDYTVKWNMCVHIHLLCRLLNEEQGKKEDRVLTERPVSSLDITDLIIYDGGGAEARVNESKEPILIHEMHNLVPEIPIEEKNMILQEFSDILLKCNSPSLFQEIVSFVGGLKAKIDSEDGLNATQTFSHR